MDTVMLYFAIHDIPTHKGCYRQCPFLTRRLSVPNLVEKLQQNRNPQFSNFTNSLPHFIFRKLSQDIWWRLENIVLSNLSKQWV
jgi:hypothetical protein